MTDLLVFGGYLVIVLLIGRITGRRIHSSEDFHLCGRDLGRLPAALSQAATEFSGSGLIGGASLAYVAGISVVWWNWAAAPVYIAVGFTIVYLLRKLKVGTTPGFLGQCYGAPTQRLAATLQVVGMVMFTGVQIKASMVTLTALFGMDPVFAAVLVTVVFVSYTMMGGLWAVVWTDVLQYGILMSGLFLATGLAFHYVGGFDGLTSNLPDRYFDPTDVGAMEMVGFFLLVMLSYSTDQMVVQRGLAAKDPNVARFAFVYTGCNYFVFGACIVFLGMSAAVLLPDLANADDALPGLISEVFPPGLRGLLLTAILAVTMSTASSALAASSAMMVQDIYEPLANRAHNKSEGQVVRDSRIATLIAGSTSLFLAVTFPNVVDMVFLGVALASAPLFVPLVLGLYWRRANPKSALWAMIATAIVGAVSAEYWYQKIDGFLGDIHYYILGPAVGLAIMLVATLLSPNNDG
jgi:SSS family solute:Na+ symporter